jgi:autotransporter adhesin
MGVSTEANGDRSTAMGVSTKASGYASTAMGYGTTASGSSSTAIGGHTQASGETSTAMGDSSTASGETSTAIGAGTLASGKISTAIGNFTTASDYASLVIGQYNASGSTATSAEAFSDENTAFVIGNGTDSFEGASDAFKVMFNGDATLSRNLTVKGDIVVSSDARLKANIVSLGSTLSRLLLIDGKSYTMIKDGKQKIGLLAQEIKEVFPELVSEDDNEMLAVNYQGLVPVLINALKEQDEKMNEQNDKISRLENLVEKLISDK